MFKSSKYKDICESFIAYFLTDEAGEVLFESLFTPTNLEMIKPGHIYVDRPGNPDHILFQYTAMTETPVYYWEPFHENSSEIKYKWAQQISRLFTGSASAEEVVKTMARETNALLK